MFDLGTLNRGGENCGISYGLKVVAEKYCAVAGFSESWQEVLEEDGRDCEKDCESE